MKKNIGIILRKHLPKAHKITILDKQLGLIEATHTQQNILEQLRPGNIIEYYQSFYQQHHQLTALDIVASPLQSAHNNIYFLHHVFELSYYFIPPHSSSENIFQLIFFLLQFHYRIVNSLQKKIFLLRFFAYLGMYPKETVIPSRVMFTVMQSSFEMILTFTDISEKNIEEWLTMCIDMHPYKNQFKTYMI